MLNLCQPQECKPSYVAGRRDWRSDDAWWAAIRAQHREPGTNKAWADATGINKSTVSKQVRGVVKMGRANALAISIAAGVFPKGLLDEPFTEALTTIIRARRRHVTDQRIIELLGRFATACEHAANEIAAWTDDDPPGNGREHPVRPPPARR